MPSPQHDPSPLPVPVAAERSPVAFDPWRSQGWSEDEIDLRGLLRVLRRHRVTVLGVAGMVVACTLLASLLMRPVYRSTALVELEPVVERLPGHVATPWLETQRREYLNTQFRILESESVVDAVVARLGLDANPEFTGDAFQRGFLSGLRELAGAWVPGSERDAGERSWRLRRSFRERLSVDPVRDANLVAVHFESFDRELAARAANAVVDEYVRLGATRRLRSASGAREHLDDQIALVEQQLEASERELNAFARRNDIVDVDDRRGLLSARVEELSQDLTAAARERVAAESLWKQMRSGRVEELAPVLESELVRVLREEESRISAEVERLSHVYKDGYPRLQQLRAQLGELGARRRQEIARLLEGIEARHEEVRQREVLLAAELEEQKRALLDLKDRAVQYHILKREWETQRDLHAALLEEAKRVSVAAGVGQGGAILVDRARPAQKPARPRPVLYAGVAALVGLGMGVALALVLGRLDDVVRTAEELERASGLTHLGSLPRLSGEELCEDRPAPERWIARRGGPFAQALRTLRAHLTAPRAGRAPRVLLVTSAHPGEGKTTTAAHLAAVLARRGSKVLLIDADLRRPRAHAHFDARPTPGLAEILAGRSEFRPQQETVVPNLSVLAAGSTDADPADLVGSPEMDVLLEQARGAFDFLVIDSPPVLGVADAVLLSPKVDAVLFVVSAQSARREAVREAVRRLGLVRARLCGAVLNQTDASEDRYGDYGYGYARGPRTQDAAVG